MSKKMKTVDDTEVVDLDLPPVELDPPDPAITRWQELGRDYPIVHEGNAELVMPFPRPAWADPDRDHIGECALACGYKSKVVKIAAGRSSGTADKDRLHPANVQVWAAVDFNGVHGIGVVTQARYTDGWRTTQMAMTVAEALELADVLRAAVDMLGGDVQ